MDHPPLRCPGPISRRSFLQTGSVGLAGLGLADLLRLRAQASTASVPAPDTAVILVWLPGGDTANRNLDLKPESPIEYRGVFKPVKTVVPGMEVCELLPLHTQTADRFSLIRSISHIYAQHGGGTQQMLTARPPLRPDGDLSNNYPAIGSVVSKMREQVHVGVPNYNLITDEGTIPGPHLGAYLGAATNPFQIGANFLTSEFKVQNLSLSSEMETQLENRIGLLQAFDEMRRELDLGGDMQGMDAFNRLAIDMLTNDRSRSAFDLTKEDDRTPRPLRPACLGSAGPAGAAAGRGREQFRHGRNEQPHAG